MARKRKRNEAVAGELNLTAMIDVAFQLLSFFIITIKPVDVLTNLDVFRPAPDSRPPPAEIKELATVLIHKDGFVLQGRKVSLDEVERQLGKISAISKDVPVVIKCTNDSRHDSLVKLLDRCAKLRLTKLSVFSM